MANEKEKTGTNTTNSGASGNTSGGGTGGASSGNTGTGSTSATKSKAAAEQQRLKKEEKARAQRRRNRQFIGFALSILIIVGAVSIVTGGINLAQRLWDTSDQNDEYLKLYEPFVWFDIIAFDSVSHVDENTIKQICIWGVLNERLDSLERNEREEPLVPSLEVDQYAARIFGPDFRFASHETFNDFSRDLRYTYDESTQMYAAPATGLDPPYLATVVDMVRESGGVRRLVLGYVSTRTGDNQIVQTPDYEHPAKYMDFMLRRDGSNYYLYAIQRNTSHTSQQGGASSLPQQPASLPPDSSASLVPSTPSSGTEDPDASGDGDGGDGSTGEDDTGDGDAA